MRKISYMPKLRNLALRVQNPLKSSVTGPSLLVNYYLEIKFHKKIRVMISLPRDKKSDWADILIFANANVA